MKKWIIIPIMALMFISIVVATEDSIITFTTTENVTIDGFCETSSGNPCTNNYQCFLSVYYPNWTEKISDRNMTYVGNGFFNVTLGQYNTTGDYKGFITCDSPNINEQNGTTRADFRVSTTTVKSLSGGFNMLGLIFIPILMSAIFLAGAVTLNKEEHNVLKIFLYLLSFVPIWLALNFASSNISYFFQDVEMINLISNTAYWLGWVFFIIIAYFSIYLIVTIVESIKKKKAERLNY